jgi:hypothetical protein
MNLDHSETKYFLKPKKNYRKYMLMPLMGPFPLILQRYLIGNRTQCVLCSSVIINNCTFQHDTELIIPNEHILI